MKTLKLFYLTTNVDTVSIKSLIENINTTEVYSISNPDTLLRDIAKFEYFGIDVEPNKLNPNSQYAESMSISTPQILVTSQSVNEEGHDIIEQTHIENLVEYNSYAKLESASL